MKMRDKTFWLKVLRNGAILTGLQFITIWAASQAEFDIFHQTALWKALLIFLSGYVLIEASKFYGIDIQKKPQLKKPKLLLFT